jgi:hypothetical protein
MQFGSLLYRAEREAPLYDWFVDCVENKSLDDLIRDGFEVHKIAVFGAAVVDA